MNLFYPFLLLVIAMLASGDTGVERESEEALLACKRMLTQSPQPLSFESFKYFQSLDFYTGEEGEDFAFFEKTSPLNYTLKSVLRFHSISSVNESSTRTVLCVGLEDTTTYTHVPGVDGAQAWVTLHTRKGQSIGLVHVDSDCWRHRKHLNGCSAKYYPLPFIVKLPQYHHSILEEEFWTNLTITGMDISQTWIWRINTHSHMPNVYVKPHWLFNMDIPSLMSLEIKGSDWRNPKNLLKPLPKLNDLDLSYNNLQAVPKDMLRKMPRLKKLILGHNNISVFPAEVEDLELYLLDLTNPLGDAILKITDDEVEKLPRTLKILGLENTRLVANVTKILLHPQLNFLNLSGCELKYIPDYIILNGSETQILSQLEYMDLSGNQLSVLPISIFHKLTKLKNLILHHNNLTKWPSELDSMREKLTILNLSKNLIQIVNTDTFAKLHKLEILDLSWNSISKISEDSFSNLSNLKEIDLSHNNLSYIDEILFLNTKNVKVIKLSNNFLKSFPVLRSMNLDVLDLSFNSLSELENFNTSIKSIDISHNLVSNLILTSAEKLNMSYTNISVILPSFWKNISVSKEVDLGGIDFECCLFGNTTFLKDRTGTIIKNLGTYDPLTCTVNKTSPNILLRTFKYNETECAPPDVSDSPLGLETIIPLAVLFTAICLVAILLYIYRFELTYLSHLFQMKRAGNITDEERYKTCAYDAFVCYSAKNFSWVAGRLLPALERPPHAYRLCVHDRDFALGAAIHRNIVASLEKSRKVILVLSRDFVASKWCQWELEMANHKMFEEKRNTIVLVELERLDRRSLPRHLRYLMARTTYLQWPTEGEMWVDPSGTVNEGFESVGEALELAYSKGQEVEGEDDSRRQRRVRREEMCLKRLREALGESLSQRRGTNRQRVPYTVLDAS